MAVARLRPWGPLSWVADRLGPVSWSILGTVSTEDRCLATVRQVGPCAGRTRFLAIQDPAPLRKEAFEAAILAKKRMFLEIGISSEEIADVLLFGNLDLVARQVGAFLDTASPDVLLDISAMPKRWFFAIMKLLLASPRVSTLVVTYASPVEYGSQLAENPDPIRMLPGFAGDGQTEYDSVIIGIGFEPLGLTNLFTDLKLKRIRLLFPFPPGPPGFSRNWMFVKMIEDMTKTQNIVPPDRADIHMFDCPQIFDAISDMTDFGSRTTVLAPYGPKTMSLAMCLFSLAAAAAGKASVPVYYAQPRRYALDYSTGIRLSPSGDQDIKAYCVKVGGRALYML